MSHQRDMHDRMKFAVCYDLMFRRLHCWTRSDTTSSETVATLHSYVTLRYVTRYSDADSRTSSTVLHDVKHVHGK